MKVLHLISGGDTGGAKTHVLSLMKELEKYVEPKIICFIEDEFYYDAKKLGIDIEVIKQNSRFDLHVLKQLKEKIKTEKYSLVHSHGARANFISMLLKPMVKVPFVTTIHSDYKLDFIESKYKKFVYTNLNEMSLKVFNYYIAISSNFKEMLIDRGFNSSKIFTAYNGIDLNETLEITPKEIFLKNYEIDASNKTIVGILGRLDAVKNHMMFLKAAREVLEYNKDIVFLLGGTGIDEEKLKKFTLDSNMEKNVKFLGFVDECDSFFNAIDINTLTSLSESFPYSILEGARQKKPILATSVGGLSDLVDQGVNGYLVSVDDYKSFAKHIEELAKDKKKTIEMGENLYKTVKEKFSLENMGKTHFEIYKEIVKDKESV